jgi:hypothetical protein
MKQNQSILRKGDAKKRWDKKVKRFETVHHLRYRAGWTWHDIGKRFKVSRQAIFKFYNEHKNLI